MNRMIVRSACAGLAALAVISAACSSRGSKPADDLAGITQFVANPSFEELDGVLPKGWRTADWRPGAAFAVADAGHEGGRSVTISSTDGADASWITTVPIRPYAEYRLSGWIKTEALEPGTGRGAQINVNGVEAWRTPAVTGTRDWTKVEVEFDAGANDALEVACLFGGWGESSGRAWFDDVRLDLVQARDPGAPAVVIDTGRVRAPMSKYVYGQFIEHLGRCIYQGIWAEMLEDRKFFWPAAEGESPWKVIGGAAVTMDKAAPFVGAHAPRVVPKACEAGGLVQGGLALLPGKSYAGRIVLAGDPAASPIHVSLVWGDAPEARQTVVLTDFGRGYKTFPLVFTPAAAIVATGAARLEVVSSGGWFKVGTASLMPADNVEGFRPEVLALLKELDAPVYRWPGGNFVSGYDWKDGIGERDLRPPRKNPAWQGVEHNDVGVHEYLDLMRILGADPYITVNSGLGDVAMAVEELEYVNGPADSPLGKRRVQNGRAEPWGVRFWSVGNEMYGSWQLGHMPLADYVKKHVRFAEAMRAKDPSIKIIAVGAVGTWDETMLAEAAGHMDYLSEHFYCGEKPGLLSHVNQIPMEIRRIAEAHRRYRATIPALADREIPVALDEWNYWYGPDLYGEIGVRYFLKDALGVAAGFNEYARQSDIYIMANYAQAVNVIGAIKTSKTAAEFDTTGLVLKLYRRRFGTLPVEVSGAAEPLDVMACWREGREVLTLSVVNPTRRPQTLKLDFGALRVPSAARLSLIAGDDPQAYNEPGVPPAVVIREMEAAPFGRSVTVPPVSVSLYEIAVLK
jgi:alpha-N-arabinofuranosidase